MKTNSVTTFPSVLLGLTTALLLCAALASAVETPPRPNVVLMVTDDQYQFGFLDSRDYTPHIDRLAEEGMYFSRAYTTAACTPSRWNILTGRYASQCTSDATLDEVSREGQYRIVWNSAFEGEKHLLPRMMRAGGYFTGHVGKNHNGVLGNPEQRTRVGATLRALRALEKDADPADPEVTARAGAYQQALGEDFRAAGFDYTAAHVHGNLDDFPVKALGVHNMEWMTRGALEFLDRANTTDKPFFLFFATTLDHGPHHKSRSLEEDPRLTPAGMLEEPITGVQPTRASAIGRAEAAGLEDRNRSVVWLDDGVGAVVNHLAKLGLEEETLFIFLTDHGMKGGKGSNYEGGVHMPLIFRWPGRIEPGRSDALVHTIDLAPTLLDLCGIEATTTFDGTSLLPLLEGRATHLRDHLLLEWGPTRSIVGPRFKYLAVRHPESVIRREDYLESVRVFREQTRGVPVGGLLDDPEFKDLVWPYDQYAGYHIQPYRPGGTTRAAVRRYFKTIYDPDQLYDLEADPRERQNLAGDPAHRETLLRMQDLLRRELAPLPGSFGEFKQLTPEEAATWKAEYARRHPER